ncbi:MAG: hypothetical protein EPO39_09415, partial [Candidatus Manganitrophaceae bacterium]
MKGALFFLLTVLPLGVAACGGGGADPASDGPGDGTQGSSIQITPGRAVLSTGNRQTFKAEGAGGDPAVRWDLQEGEAGGSIAPDGNYTAPAAPGVYHIVAVNLADPSDHATAEVEVVKSPVVSVAVEPAVLTLPPEGSRLFTATVSSSDQTAVTWSVVEGEIGGSVDPQGHYTAPATPGTYHVVATSAADPTKQAEATVRVLPLEKTAPRFAYTVNSFSNDVSIFSIDPATGAPAQIGAIAAGREPYTVTVDPMGRFVYVGNFGSNDISMYAIDGTTGLLNPLGTVQTGAGPYSIRVDPSGRFVYMANENSSTDVWIYQLHPEGGALTPIGSVEAGISPISLAVDPLGGFVYVANNSSDDLSIFSVDAATGNLSPIGAQAAGRAPNAVAVHPSGRFVYAANYGSGDVWSYRVDPS